MVASLKSETIAQVARDNLCILIDRFLQGSGMAESYASHKLYGNSNFFAEFRRGKKSITVQKLHELVEEFRQNWPAGSDWPDLRPMSFPEDASENRVAGKPFRSAGIAKKRGLQKKTG